MQQKQQQTNKQTTIAITTNNNNCNVNDLINKYYVIKTSLIKPNAVTSMKYIVNILKQL